jgi:L-iditol 2-dehydrogenase
MQMKSSVLRGIREIGIQEHDLPTPGRGEVLIRVRACSVCGSDVRIFNHGNDRVKYPAVLGHEMAGDVVAVGESVARFKVGDRICVGADVPSMQDEWSTNGMANLCDINYAIGYQFPGGFAEYCLLNELTVRYGPVAVIPDGLDYAEAALSEPLACCLNGLERSFLEAGKSVLIFGAGPIGILLARAARAMGASLVAMFDTDGARAEQARRLGIIDAYDSTEIDPVPLALELTNGLGFNAVFTACPSADAQEIAVRTVSKRGVVNFFGGLPKSAREIRISSNFLHYREAYITGSHGSTPRQHRTALQMIANGQVEVKSLITHEFPLDQTVAAFRMVEDREGLKVVIKP